MSYQYWCKCYLSIFVVIPMGICAAWMKVDDNTSRGNGKFVECDYALNCFVDHREKEDDWMITERSI